MDILNSRRHVVLYRWLAPCLPSVLPPLFLSAEETPAIGKARVGIKVRVLCLKPCGFALRHCCLHWGSLQALVHPVVTTNRPETLTTNPRCQMDAVLRVAWLNNALTVPHL